MNRNSSSPKRNTVYRPSLLRYAVFPALLIFMTPPACHNYRISNNSGIATCTRPASASNEPDSGTSPGTSSPVAIHNLFGFHSQARISIVRYSVSGSCLIPPVTRSICTATHILYFSFLDLIVFLYAGFILHNHSSASFKIDRMLFILAEKLSLYLLSASHLLIISA